MELNITKSSISDQFRYNEQELFSLHLEMKSKAYSCREGKETRTKTVICNI